MKSIRTQPNARVLFIRSEQEAVLRQSITGRVERELRAHVEQHFPRRCAQLDEEDLEAFLRRAVACAQRRGLRGTRDLYAYVSLSMLYGAELGATEDTLWMRDYLDDPHCDPPQRIARLYTRVLKDLEQQEAERRAQEVFGHVR